MENAEKSLIAKFSTFFVRNYRTTILIFVGVLVLGYGAYTSFLTREGFPAVQVPIVFIQAPYFVDDAEKVNEEVTIEIEDAIADITEINKVQSTTGNNFSFIIVEFDQDFSSKEGSRLIKEQVDKDANLPEGVEVKFQTLNDRYHEKFGFPFVTTLSTSPNIATLAPTIETPMPSMRGSTIGPPLPRSVGRSRFPLPAP